MKAAQSRMQQAEVKFVSPATGGVTSQKEVHWLATAVQASRDNLSKLSTALQVPSSDITVFNIVALQTRGMLSSKLLDSVRHHVLMGGIDGPILIVYTMIPSKVYSGKRTASTGSSASSVLGGAFGDAPASGGDGECDSSQDDDFDEDGQLPEVITRGATLMTAWQRAAALAKDHFTIDSKLGQHDLSKYYPIGVAISRKAEDEKRTSDKAMVLVPASGGGERMPFHGAVFYKDGLYTDVDVDDTYINVSKKASMSCKKDMAQHWKCDLPVVNYRGRVSNKAARGQLGVAAYQAIIMDLMLHCETSTLLINDFLGALERRAWRPCGSRLHLKQASDGSEFAIGVLKTGACLPKLPRPTFLRSLASISSTGNLQSLVLSPSRCPDNRRPLAASHLKQFGRHWNLH